MYCYINGDYVSGADAKVSVLDLGLVRGYGIFEYLRTYQGRPFQLREHLLRLKYSADAIGLTLPNSLEEIKGIIGTLLGKSGPAPTCIKVLVTGGVSADQLMPGGNPSLIALAYPCQTLPEEYYRHGIKVGTTSLARSNPASKTTQYTPAIMALQQGGGLQSVQEMLYLDAHGNILEATTSNFFAFQGDTLITPPPEKILLGITREVVLKIAANCFPIEIRPIPYWSLDAIDEVFITSSGREIMPVRQIDGQPVGTGEVGSRTKRMMQLFAAYTQQPAWPDLCIARYGPSHAVEQSASFHLTT